jgi:hypothetical protein
LLHITTVSDTVLVMGFSAVIVLLLAAGFTGVKNAQLIEESAGALVRNQLVTTRLIEELQREQDTVNAAFYKISSDPEATDRDRLLSQLDGADKAIQRMLQEMSGTVEEPLWRDLSRATVEFSSEAGGELHLTGAGHDDHLFVTPEQIARRIPGTFRCASRWRARPPGWD